MTEPADGARVTQDEALAHELRQLGDSVAALRDEVRRSSGALPPQEDTSGWDDGGAVSAHTWVSSLATPQRASLRIPRLPLELLFIAAAAVLAGVADLRPAAIAAVMGAAWVIVALAEWAGSRGDRIRAQIYLSPIAAAPQLHPAAAPADPNWFTPPVEHTLLASVADQATSITTLPPPLEDPETTAERRPDS